MILDLIAVSLLYFIYQYGSVFETQYPDYIYLLGDERWIILLYIVISMGLLYVDIKVAILFMLLGFFITNDVPIINSVIFNETFGNELKDVKQAETMINHYLEDMKMDNKIETLSNTLDTYYLTLKENLTKKNL
jgi:hypothetical protein